MATPAKEVQTPDKRVLIQAMKILIPRVVGTLHKSETTSHLSDENLAQKEITPPIDLSKTNSSR